MSEDQAAQGAGEVPAEQGQTAERRPFPFARLLYALGFGFVAWFVFWIIAVLAAVQFITIAIAGQKNGELEQFSRLMSRYMQELLAYVTMTQDRLPFPLGPFPKE